MDWEITSLHPEFRLNGNKCSVHDLNEIGYSLIKEGYEFERHIGDFLIDWFSDEESVLVNTSGSTGTPKTIHLKKASMAHSAKATGEFLNIGEGSEALLCLPASNIAGKMMLVRAITLGWHMEFVAPSKFPLSRNLKTYDFIAMVPMQVAASITELKTVKNLLIGGAPINKKLKSDLQHLETRVFESYGMTETASHVAMRPVNEAACDAVNGSADLFKTMDGVTVTLDDRGCLVVHADYISSDAIITNDLAEVVSPDQFRWLGRWDHVINSGGVKLIPEQIETKLQSAIGERFILAGLTDESLGEKLVLIVEGKIDKITTLNAIKKIPQVDKYEIPKEVYLLDEFPETPSGKIHRKQIIQMISGDN